MQENNPQNPTAGQSGHPSDARGHMLLPLLALTVLFLALVARAAADPTLWSPAPAAQAAPEATSRTALID